MLLLVLQVAAVFLIAVTMGFALAHALDQANCVSMSRRIWLCKLSTIQASRSVAWLSLYSVSLYLNDYDLGSVTRHTKDWTTVLYSRSGDCLHARFA